MTVRCDGRSRSARVKSRPAVTGIPSAAKYPGVTVCQPAAGRSLTGASRPATPTDVPIDVPTSGTVDEAAALSIAGDADRSFTTLLTNRVTSPFAGYRAANADTRADIA